MLIRVAVVLTGALVARPLVAQGPRDIVARAVAAMGGEPALRAVNGIAIDFYTVTFALGQEETPESPARATVAYGRTTSDYAAGRQTTASEQRALTGAVNKLRRITAGGIGMLETNGLPAPDQPATVAAFEAGLRRAPHRLLLAALDNPAGLSILPAHVYRGYPHDGVRYASGRDTLNLYFDRVSGLLTVTETIGDDPILGDRRTTIWFTRWQATGGVRFARQHNIEVNGRLQSHSVFTAVALNPDLPDSLFAIPDSIAGRAQRSDPNPPPVVVSLVVLVPGGGGWRAEGGSPHSLVVEQPTQLVVVEAPLTAVRSRAVLDTLRSRFPSKRVGLVVNTHHHWDHAGGVRAYVAAGIPVVTHGRNTSFVRGLARAPKTVTPDALSRRPPPRVPDVRPVTDSLIVGTGERRVVIYRLPTAHVEGMLAAYLPAARILFTSDVLSPSATLPPAGSAEVVEFARSRGIPIERVAGGHGGVANWADVEKAASQ